MADAPTLTSSSEDQAPSKGLSVMTLGALGVVFGDLGTSPLYAFKAAFAEPLFKDHGVGMTNSHQVDDLMGVLSLFLWSIVIVICLKYVIFMMRADNDGEGGVLAMFSLLQRKRQRASRTFGRISARGVMVFLAIVGAALLYGDGVITPAISVLAAAEGINFAMGGSAPTWLAPLVAVGILILLFALQRFGTGAIGFLFGPIMLIWFLVIAALGIGGIIVNPSVLMAINPMWAINLFASDPWLSFVVLGAVVLCITGCEALSLDMGHFGRIPIRLAWFGLVFPSLLLNYFGQAAVLLSSKSPGQNPFYLLVPEVVLIPMIVLAIVAAVIASQAIIAGAFSITKQAIQLLFLPATSIRHTSKTHMGQIYVPLVNRWMLVMSVILVLAFKTSDSLGAAYGLAVTGVMVVSTIMLAMVARLIWKWSWFLIIPLLTGFFIIDLAFLGANLMKVPNGGWVPLAIGFFMVIVMLTWRRGISLISETRMEEEVTLESFMEQIREADVPRVPGAGVFLTSSADMTPISLLKLYRHMPVLHEEVIIVHFVREARPRVPKSEHVVATQLDEGFWQLTCPIGYLQEPYLPRLLKESQQQGLHVKPDKVTYYIRKDLPSRVRGRHMSAWRKELFFGMLRNSCGPVDLLNLPPSQVIEVGIRLNF